MKEREWGNDAIILRSEILKEIILKEEIQNPLSVTILSH